MCSTIVPQMKPRMPVPNKSSFVFRGADSRVKGVVFSTTLRFLNNLLSVYNTGYTQKNGAVSKFNKKLISQLTRAQRTPSTAATVQVSHAYCGAAGSVFKMASQQEKTFCVLRFEVSRSVITVQREFRARFRKDPPCMVGPF